MYLILTKREFMGIDFKNIINKLICLFLDHDFGEVKMSLTYMIKYRQCKRCKYKFFIKEKTK